MWDKQLTDSFYGQYAPTFSDQRIDYILTSPEITSAFNSKVIGDPRKLSTAAEPSDHLPLVTTVQLPEPIPSKTQIIIKCDAGWGNKLYIRGDGPGMNWEKGIKLRNIDKDTWVFETQSGSPSFEYKILFNDKDWETGCNHKIGCQKNQEINPQFKARTTQIIVKCDAGWGNKLFIRGNGPGMSWEKGIELRNIDKDTWVFETQTDLHFEYKVRFNDKVWETGCNHKIGSKKKQKIRPSFSR
jgi:hypothetical protein